MIDDEVLLSIQINTVNTAHDRSRGMIELGIRLAKLLCVTGT